MSVITQKYAIQNSASATRLCKILRSKNVMVECYHQHPAQVTMNATGIKKYAILNMGSAIENRAENCRSEIEV
ncbi:hypothetical protein AC249_AIPGENE6341 [Exaiptasia diaphana]|nr:hypothetical protein AC249_AIPGENE6341 [Exaiptasia diaphana]